ncbi:hypothetical protein CWATWH0401_3152 [Crocosphaera watsonii WH 0401]|uniref:Uncharacterized protein n=1 Tax=Crocosphaera watsonii WH 0401 TaxID=555881 RepID=T2J365_CROWT|nr:hypothetical protein CWATWH0401_3152 [Crocosphaera watsonii WH 0401]
MTLLKNLKTQKILILKKTNESTYIREDCNLTHTTELKKAFIIKENN